MSPAPAPTPRMPDAFLRAVDMAHTLKNYPEYATDQRALARHVAGRFGLDEQEGIAAVKGAATFNGRSPATFLKSVEDRDAERTGDLRLTVPAVKDMRRIDWLWRHPDRGGFLPVGYFNLLVGEEGLGKTVLVCWITARVTRGELPGDFAGNPQNVLIVADEDDVSSVWTPRLVAAGADLSRIRFLAGGEDVNLSKPGDVDMLRRAVDATPIGLVVFDQLLDQLDGGQDGQGVYNAKHVRGQIRPLRKLVREAHDGRGAASLSLLHPIKGQVKTFRDLVGGSHQFNALSRSSLLLARDPDDVRGASLVVVRGKGNLSTDPGSFGFEIAGRTFDVEHLDPPELNAPVVIEPEYGRRTKEELMQQPDRKSEQLDALKLLLRAQLTAEDQSLADLARAVNREPNDRTVRRALEALADEDIAAFTKNPQDHIIGWRLASPTTKEQS